MRWIKNLYFRIFGPYIRSVKNISVPEMYRQRVRTTLEWIVENEKIKAAWNKHRTE